MRSFILSAACLGSVILAAQAQEKAQPAPASRQKQPAAAHHEATSGDMHKQMQAMNKMMVHHLGEGDSEFERRFIDMMIPHHEGAVLMARHALKHSNRPELKEMAEKIITSQEQEIAQLKRWRQEWYHASGGKEVDKSTK